MPEAASVRSRPSSVMACKETWASPRIYGTLSVSAELFNKGLSKTQGPAAANTA